MDLSTFNKENCERIKAVESSFRASGRPLSKPGRVLIGQGRLMKRGRRKPQPKVFFLFNDVLVYGSIIVNGHWHKNMKIIPLEDIQLEDMEDGVELKNQWLIRTPCKSFFVSAPSVGEKQAWMEHMEDSRLSLLQGGSRQPGSTFAVTWIPDQAAYKCMRCFKNFSPTKRRHHCRKCGFLVCHSCSKHKVVIDHIHPTKKLRVCKFCNTRNKIDERSRLRGDSTGQENLEEEDVVASSEEEEAEGIIEDFPESSWLDSHTGTWGNEDIYDYPRPMHLRP
ncbi:pleckstrin homology domain-containing family F member 2-like [Pagrus major]|uniref:pleckstrin homology domain-containing family F member 2-like n=1 Tax=Pagrus major TaxID=143350 RepID=UPI003CC8BDC7